MLPKMVRPDSKGRITLGHLADGVSSFSIMETPDHKIILEPYTEIPARERWLFNNKKVLKMLEQGIKDSAAGRLTNRGSFSKYIQDKDE